MHVKLCETFADTINNFVGSNKKEKSGVATGNTDILLNYH